MFTNKLEMLKRYDQEKTIIIHRVESKEIQQLHKYYKYFKKRVYELDNDYLKEKFLILKELYQQIISSIEPYDNLLEEFNFPALSEFITRLSKSDAYEETSEVVKNFIVLLKEFRSGNIKNKLYSNLKMLYEKINGKNKIVLDYYWKVENEEFIQGRVGHYTTGDKFYDAVFFLRSPNYYPTTKTVLKAKKVYYLSYDIFQSTFKETLIISGNKRENSALFDGVDIVYQGSKKIVQDEDTFEQFFTGNNDYAKNWIRNYQSSSNDVTTKAQLFGLIQGEVVLFPTSSRLRLLNKETGVISKENSSNVKIGDWLVIRQSSDEAFIKNSARDQLGKSYDYMFEEVTGYKNKLLKIIHDEGSILVLKKKFAENDILVELQVLKNWIYGDTIRPKEYEKILELLSYKPSKIKELMNFASKIHGAHSNAGRELGKKYQEFINQIGIDEIKNKMRDFYRLDIEIEKFGTFTIETITYIGDQIVEVEYGDLYRRFKSKDRYDYHKK